MRLQSMARYPCAIKIDPHPDGGFDRMRLARYGRICCTLLFEYFHLHLYGDCGFLYCLVAAFKTAQRIRLTRIKPSC